MHIGHLYVDSRPLAYIRVRANTLRSTIYASVGGNGSVHTSFGARKFHHYGSWNMESSPSLFVGYHSWHILSPPQDPVFSAGLQSHLSPLSSCASQSVLMTNVQCTMNCINLLAYLLSHCRDVSLQILGLLITYFLLVVQFSNPTTGSTYITIVTTNSSIMDLKSTSGFWQYCVMCHICLIIRLAGSLWQTATCIGLVSVCPSVRLSVQYFFLAVGWVRYSVYSK